MENTNLHTPAFDMVLFGGTGDLVMRKLLPSLYQAHAAGLLHDEGRLLALGRRDMSRDDYLAMVEKSARVHIKEGFADAAWSGFLARVDYLTVDAATGSSCMWQPLGKYGKPSSMARSICLRLPPVIPPSNAA